MPYDPKRNYADEINAAIASGAPRETVAQLNAERNEKIAANADHYAAQGISSGDQYGTAAQNYIAGTPSQTVPQSATPQSVPQSATSQSVPQSAAPQSVPRTTDDLRQLAAQQYGRTPLAHADTSAIRGYLEQSRDASVAQANEQIERGVTRGVNELARTREEADAQYQTSLNQVDVDERRGLDNQALYAAARGDRGGVGAEQYNSIMNAAAQNRVTINNARTKMRTEVGRQMAQLRADGESAKADAYFQAVQNYMAQLVQIEQWEQQFNVSVNQFNAEMDRAYLEYLAQLRQMDIATEQWEREFAANRDDAAWSRNFQTEQANVARNQWEREFAANRADTAWNQNFQTNQAEIARNQWQQEFNANRDDAAWNRNFQTDQANVARNQWEREFAANREDTAWQQLFQEGQAAFQRQQTELSRADTERQNAIARAESMMNVGMTPDAETLKAAGLSKEYAQLYISMIKAAKDLSTAQAAAELENKQADTLKKIAEAGKTSGAASAGDLSALAKAYVNSGADSPKTWLANNYKSFGFTSKPDNDEFEDAVDAVREKLEKGITADAGAGVNAHSFDLFQRRIDAAFDDGKPESALQQIDRIWGRLDGNQRRALLKTLSKYGLTYEPEA